MIGNPIDKIVEVIRVEHQRLDPDFSEGSVSRRAIQDELRGEFERGQRLGLENAFYELDAIFGSHIADEPHRGIVALVLDLARVRLDLD